MSESANTSNHAAFIWSVADLLRGDYKQSEYGKVILPFTVVRRFDCVLDSTKQDVLDRNRSLGDRIQNRDPVLCQASGQPFFNTSPLTFRTLLDDPNNLKTQLQSYLDGFSSNARDVLEKFDFSTQINRLANSDLLYLVTSRFADINLHPNAVSNIQMGYIYEELIRKFSELSNETAGEHFTPREVIRLMVNLLFSQDTDALTKQGAVRTIYDPACGTGGMLAEAEENLRLLNPDARLEVFGQELNPETFAICQSDMMLKGYDSSRIVYGNSFSEDGYATEKFDYVIANPPFGVDWKKVERSVRDEHNNLGFRGRFGAGLPSINDGQFLFLQHMISKMKPVESGGSRIAAIFNGSPLTVGAPGSDEAEIRRWILENDWLETIVALPSEIFYNTGIGTYIWILTNRKEEVRRGKVQLLDARHLYNRPSVTYGDKRKELSHTQIDEISRWHAEFSESPTCKIFDTHRFGLQQLLVQRPLRARWKGSELIRRVKDRDCQMPLELQKLPLQSLESFDANTRKSAETMTEQLLPSLSRRRIRQILTLMCERSPEYEIVLDSKGRSEPDEELRAIEFAPFPAASRTWSSDISDLSTTEQFREVVQNFWEVHIRPYAPDSWVDHSKTSLGYEIPFSRYFYREAHHEDTAILANRVDALSQEIQQLRAALTELRAQEFSASPSSMVPLGFLVKEIFTPNTDGLEDNRLSLSFGRVIRRSIDSIDGLRPGSFDTYQIVEKDDIILRLTDLQNDQRSLRVGVVEERGIISPAYLNLRVNSSVLPRYLAVVLKSIDSRKLLYVLGGGIRQSLGFTGLRRLMIPLLSHDAQEHLIRVDQLAILLDSATRELIHAVVAHRQGEIGSLALGELENV